MSGSPSLGLVTPTRGRAGERLARWLLAGARGRRDLVLHRAGDDGAGPWHALVLLVPQYGPVPAPTVEQAVVAHAERWAGRPVAIVAYGGVSRGRDAAARIGGLLRAADAAVLDAVLGVNVAELRRTGGPGPFERVAWEIQLDGLVAASAPSSTIR